MLAKEIWIISWTSYPSRRVRRKETLDEYKSASEDSYLLASEYNFNEGDGMSTACVFSDNPETTDRFSGNYVLVISQDGSIASRWFVMGVDRTTLWGSNQCKAYLRRDVVADKLSNLLNAKAFIEKGTIQSSSNPFIWNKEEGTFNQIKKEEALIKDESAVSWLIGYVPQDAFSSEDESDRRIEFGVADLSTIPEKLRFATLEDCAVLYKFQNGMAAEDCEVTFVFGAGGDDSIRGSRTFQTTGYLTSSTSGATIHLGVTPNAPRVYKNAYNQYLSDYQGQVSSYTSNAILANVDKGSAVELFLTAMGCTKASPAEMDELLDLNGRTIYIEEDGKAYDVSVEAVQGFAKSSATSAGANYMATNLAAPTLGTWTGYAFTSKVSAAYKVTMTEASLSKNYVVLTKASVRAHLIDAPYDMFAIPYADGKQIVLKDETSSTTYLRTVTTYRTSKAIAMSVATAIAAKLGSATVYDVQELPYCPIREALIYQGYNATDPRALGGYSVNIQGQPNDLAYSSGGTDVVASITWCRRSNFSFEVPAEGFYSADAVKIGAAWSYVPANERTASEALLATLKGWAGKSALGNKIANQVDVFRLTSPNMASSFEFSESANKGVAGYVVDCTYKPFSPFIHVSPKFGGLYGTDFGDARGLILGGDFSLTQLTSSWADYQLSNKNYQAIFDRQITNMEITQKYQRIGEGVSIASGALSAGVQGAAMGSAAGPIGAVAGAVAGTAASLAGGIADYNMGENLRQEALDYKKDMFSYQLGNIKAMPYGLSKTSSINVVNKHWPMLEWYSCTDEERKALEAKIEANGMTIGAIAAVADYAPADSSYHYIKGQLILPEGDGSMDARQFTSLAEEFLKGIYLRRL